MDIALALTAGLLLGGGVVYLLTRDQLRGMAALVGATEARDTLHDQQHARDSRTILELAHKVSAPEQGAIDHVFDKAQQELQEKKREDERLRKLRIAEQEMLRVGIDPDDMNPAALLDPELMAGG